MPWVKIDEHFYDHPKWADAPGDSIALWLAAMAWCNRNDSTEGFIPSAKLRGLVNIKNVGRTCADLVGRTAFHPVERNRSSGYLIHDYPEFQQPDKVKEIAAKRSAAGKKGARNRWAERDRAREYADAPPPDDAATGEANAMADEMPNAMANGWPDNRLPITDVATSERSSTSTDLVAIEGGLVEVMTTSSFDAFWTMYPHKVGKKATQANWSRLSARDQRSALEALPRHIALWEAEQRELSKIKYPQGWLSDRRWEDEIRMPEHKPHLNKSNQAAATAIARFRGQA